MSSFTKEQLEGAFYAQVASNPPSAFSAAENPYFQDIQFHEIPHCEFSKNAGFSCDRQFGSE